MKLLRLVSMALIAMLVACGKAEQTPELFNETTEQYSIQSALDGLDEVLEAEPQEAAMFQAFSLRTETNLYTPWRLGHECIIENLSPALGSESCASSPDGKTVVSQFQGCLKGTKVFGANLSFAFDAPATCDAWISGDGLPTSGSLHRDVHRLNMSMRGGRRVLIHSNEKQNYQGETISGGITTNFFEGYREIEIQGLNKLVGHRRLGKRRVHRFQSIRTVQPLQVVGSSAEGNRQVKSGAVQIDFNHAQFSSVTTYKDVQWSAECCYPVGGAISLALTGSLQGSVEVTFGECGHVSFAKTDAQGQTASGNIVLEACESSTPAGEGDETVEPELELE